MVAGKRTKKSRSKKPVDPELRTIASIVRSLRSHAFVKRQRFLRAYRSDPVQGATWYAKDMLEGAAMTWACDLANQILNAHDITPERFVARLRLQRYNISRFPDYSTAPLDEMVRGQKVSALAGIEDALKMQVPLKEDEP